MSQPKPPQNIDAVKESFVRTYWNDRYHIQSVGVGEHEGRPAIRVTIPHEESRKKFPSEFEGVPVVITEAPHPPGHGG